MVKECMHQCCAMLTIARAMPIFGQIKRAILVTHEWQLWLMVDGGLFNVSGAVVITEELQHTCLGQVVCMLRPQLSSPL